ncbi:nuclear envelope pore membrane protein POM 121-like [Rhinophrynus dorsalis]
MGSYLGKQELPARAAGRGSRDIKEKLARPNPSVVTPARRLSFREAPDLSNRTYMSPRRRYPIHQPQYCMPGSLPMVCLNGYQRKPLLVPKNPVVRSPVTVKIARLDSSIAKSPVLDQLLPVCPESSSVPPTPDPCAKETVLNAIRESRKRANKDDDHSISGGIENKRRRQGIHESRGLILEPLEDNGPPSSLLLRSDNSRSGLQVSDDHVSKLSCSSSNSSMSNSTMTGIPMSAHNAIISSYSSTRYLLQKRKRSAQNTSNPTSRCDTPEWPVKKARDELHEINHSTPVLSNSREHSSGNLSETPISKKSTIKSPSETGSGGGRWRKKMLLVCSGKDDQYLLPLPPIPGYNITSEDFDSAKKAALQRLNKALDEPLPVSSAPAATSSSPLFSLPTSTRTSLESQTTPASSNPLLQSLAKMQGQDGSQVPTATIAVTQSSSQATTAIPNMSLNSFTTGSSSTDGKKPNPTPSLSSADTPVTSLVPQSLHSAPPKSESPKNSLLKILGKPVENNAQPAFKPIFETPQTANSPTVTLSTTGLSATTNTVTATTFKPIFGDSNSQPAQTTKPMFGDSSSQPASANTFKPIFGVPGSQVANSAAASPFTLQVSTSTAVTQSFSNLGGAVNGTGPSTDNTVKPTLVIPTISNTNTTSSSTAPTFQFGAAASQSLSTSSSSTTSLLGSNPTVTSQTKPAAPFGQAPTSQANAGFVFSSQTPLSSNTQSLQATAFGSTTSAFTATFGSNTNPSSFPSIPVTASFNSGSGSDVQAGKSTTTTLPAFAGSVGQTTFGTSTQTPFGSSSQPAFGASVQPTFGTTNTSFSFGNTASAATKPATFGSLSNTQTNSTPNTSVFGGGTAAPFSFGGGSSTNMPFMSGTQSNSTAGTSGFNFGAAASIAPAPSAFGSSSVTQHSIGTTNQNTTFNFGTPGTTENKVQFGTSTPAFGQSSSATGVLSFGTPAGPVFPNTGPSFSPSTPSFSIGSGSKPSGARQRLQARRQHPRKK